MSVIHNPYPNNGAGATYTLSPGNDIGITTANSSWTHETAKITAHGVLNIKGSHADIRINEVSIMEILDKITGRLAILQPNPEHLAKYEALQQAYEHYKTLEALLYDDSKPDTK